MEQKMKLNLNHNLMLGIASTVKKKGDKFENCGLSEAITWFDYKFRNFSKCYNILEGII
jgi:hypothetical protein